MPITNTIHVSPAYLQLSGVSHISAEVTHSASGAHWLNITFKVNGSDNDAPIALTLFTVDAETADRYADAINAVAMESV